MVAATATLKVGSKQQKISNSVLVCEVTRVGHGLEIR